MHPLGISWPVVLLVLLALVVGTSAGEDPPPVAKASIIEDPDGLWNGLPIHFTSNGSEGADLTWDFGDGTEPSTVAHPVHVYDEPGTYIVNLTVTGHGNETAQDTLTLTIQFNYGDSDIVMKAVGRLKEDTFNDPWPGNVGGIAVRRDGWVAYLCELRTGDKIDVRITIIGDRAVDVFLFTEADFQTYKDNPRADVRSFEADGHRPGLVGEFNYSFKARQTDRYYVVIDNIDQPTGTGTEGPVDYTITIANYLREPGGDDGPWTCVSVFALMGLAIFGFLGALYLRREG